MTDQAIPQPRKRKRGEDRISAHALVPHPLNKAVCEFCGLKAGDKAHMRPERVQTAVTKRNALGMFEPGTAGGPGRLPGPHEATEEVRALCRRIVTDPVYCDNLILRARAGVLPPGVEVTIFHYAIGKPPEKVEVQGGSGFQIVFMGPRRDPLAGDPMALQEGTPEAGRVPS